VAYAKLAPLLLVAVAGCGGGSSPDAPKPSVRTTDSGTVIATAVDADRGVHYEVQSAKGFGSSLYVRLTKGAPDSTRKAVLNRQVAFTCRVPGAEVSYFPQVWARSKKQVGTALQVSGANEPIVAKVATTCSLWTPKPGPRPGTVEFSGKPFSRVKLR
jgi:hypothetical protein